MEEPELVQRLEVLRADLATLSALVIKRNKPISEGDVRSASAILRRWINEGNIGKLANELRCVPTFPVLDNAKAVSAIKANGSVAYFLTGGVYFDGRPLQAFFFTPERDEALDQVWAEQTEYVYVNTGTFKSQPRVYHDGLFFKTEEIIKFVANKLGGVHHDFRRDEREELMERAARFMTFGGPRSPLGSPGFHLAVESGDADPLTGFHVEVIAAAASFLNCQMNGVPIVTFDVKRSWRNKLRDIFGRSRKPTLRMFSSPDNDS